MSVTGAALVTVAAGNGLAAAIAPELAAEVEHPAANASVAPAAQRNRHCINAPPFLLGMGNMHRQ